jgi:PAS domain S-box-containing protein
MVSGDTDLSGETSIVVFDNGAALELEGETVRTLDLNRRLGFRINLVRYLTASDGEGIWFGTTDRLYLFRSSVTRWGRIERDFPDSRNRVHGLMVHSRTGRLWQATAGGVNVHESVSESRWYTEIAGKDVTIATGLAEAADGTVWLSSGASFRGVLRFSGEWEYFGSDQGLESGPIHRIVTSPDSTVWFAGLEGDNPANAGAYRWHPRTGFEDWSRAHGIAPANTYDVLDRGAEVWVANADGLHRVRDGVTTAIPIGPPGSMLGQATPFALADFEGRVWFSRHPRGTGGVGYVGPNDEIVMVRLPGGIPGQKAWSMTVDPAGDLWVGTDAGVVRLHDGRWALFGNEQGLDAGGVWPVAFTETSTILGTQGSGIRILTRSEESDPPPIVTATPPIVEDGTARVEWRPVSWWGGVRSELVETRHRIDGGDWSEWHGPRNLTLTGLRPGMHAVEIEAKGLFGQVADHPTAIPFDVQPPLFLRPLFAIPMGLLTLALLLLLGYMARRKAEQAKLIATNELRLRKLVESAPEAIGLFSVQTGRFIDVNENALRLFGIGQPALQMIDPFSMSVEPDRESRQKDMISRALSGETVIEMWQVQAASGEQIPCEIQVSRLAEEDLLRLSLIDRRERVKAEVDRHELEAQLRQSQKLEAMGQLTGGIAHDFNNLLTVIRGNLDLLKSSPEGLGTDGALLVETAIHAADRSADLTARLLAFSRKQPLVPRPVDLRDLLHGLSDLLRRTLGETIHFSLILDPALGHILVDPNGLENAILNLAINSRDAMPRGGELTVKATNVELDDFGAAMMEGIEPGHYVTISVADTGAGMRPDIVERAFDPFFTTKGVGEGSGLGLSMVYGFVRQSGGAARLHSELGRGSTVEIFLPQSTDEPTTQPPQPTGEESPAGNGEKILVVEDDHAVRTLIVTVLSRLGYQVHSEDDAHAGVRYLETGADVDLLLSDIVLPGGMHGIELGRIAQTMRPELRVLHVSGYAEESVLRLVEDDPHFDLLKKPFERSALAQRVRNALDRDKT